MYKIIQDPVNGPVKIDGLFSEIVDSQYFQRLRYIKQLGLCNLVFPGANHSRFEHSLGTMFMAHELSEALEIKDEIPSIAALLHDIGHMPFSHGLENEFYGLYKVVHEDLTKNIILGENPYDDSTIPGILEKYGYSPSDIADVATGSSKKYPLFSTMISGPIDVDEIDYLRRDALFCGVTMGQIDYKRLFMSSFNISLFSISELKTDSAPPWNPNMDCFLSPTKNFTFPVDIAILDSMSFTS